MKYKEGSIVYLRPWKELCKQKGFRRYSSNHDAVCFDDNCGHISRDYYERFFGKQLTVLACAEDDSYEVPVCYKLVTADGLGWWFGESYIQIIHKKIKYFNRRG